MCISIHAKYAFIIGVTFWGGMSASVEAEIIRCPDWQALAPVDRSMLVRARTNSPESFDATLARARASLSAATAAPLDGANLRGQSGAVTTIALPASCSYTVRPTDTLSRIAGDQLGNASRYPDIIALNRDTLHDPNLLTVGSTLTLPCAAPSAAAGQGGTVTPAAPSAPQPAPAPVWTARAGDGFIATVEKWARSAGYTVVNETAEDWTFAVAINESGSFVDVLQRVVRGLGAQGTPPAVQIFSNKVVKIGGL